MKLKFAVVGCGSIGKRHVAVLDAEPLAELVAICDKDLEKCAQITNLYGQIPVYSDYNQMLDEIDADIIN
ncbi:MAG: Gfo/Idh/MocA family oxidoreductase, partial [Flavobacteriales bacterium]|nr:Gfo/Idh/MocA family oxidoreductase [Flavobacteriales bacterium]